MFSGQKTAEQTDKMHGIQADEHTRHGDSSCANKPAWYALLLSLLKNNSSALQLLKPNQDLVWWCLSDALVLF